MSTVLVWLPSTASSSTPVTVTVCGVSQSVAVNVRLAGFTVASPVSLLDISRTTSVLASALSTTVKVSVPPVSLTVAFDLDTVKPVSSSSVVVTLTV